MTTDLPRALVTRWLAWIKLQDFNICHVPGKRNTVANKLLQRPFNKKDVSKELENNINKFINSAFLVALN